VFYIRPSQPFSCKGYLIYLPHFYIFLEHQTGDGSTFHKDDTKPTLKLLHFNCPIIDNYDSNWRQSICIASSRYPKRRTVDIKEKETKIFFHI